MEHRPAGEQLAETIYIDGILHTLFDGQREGAAEWFSGSVVVAPAASEMRDGAPFGKRVLTIEAGRIVQA